MKNITTLFTDEKFKICGIYTIMFGDYKYIGSSKNIYLRLKDHYKTLKNKKHHNTTMQRLFNKYGETIMMYDIVEICCEIQLLQQETIHINLLKRPYRINHILDPVNGNKDDTYKKRLSTGCKNSFKNGRETHNQKETHMYTLDGKYIKSFKNATLAAKEIKNEKAITAICSAARGVTYTAYNYRWSYQKVDSLNILVKNFIKSKITQLTLNGIVIRDWDSITEAQNDLKITNIIRAIKKKLTAGNFRWEYKKS